VDVEEAKTGEIEELVAPLSLHPLAIEGCVEPSEGMRVEVFEGAIFLSYPGGNLSDLDASHTRALCLPDLLVTFRDGPLPELEAKLARSAIRLQKNSIAAILFYLVDLNQDNNLHAALKLRDQVTQLADRIEDDFESVDGGDILSLKRQTTFYAATFEDQYACLNIIRQVGSDVMELASLEAYYGNLVSSLEYLIRMMGRIDLQLQDARQQYQSELQDKANRRLNVLTIVQSIFVPLTLIAGIYGMNFVFMPELQWRFAYQACLALMAVVAVGELWIFYRRGWFG
jgi:magnesium transporter